LPHERVIGIDDVEIVALATIYAADRADQAATTNNAVALLGAGIAYATATLAFFDQIVSSLSSMLVALLGLPLWMVVLYHALLVGVSMGRTASIRILEQALLGRTTLAGQQAVPVGYGAVEQVLNPFRASWSHKVASVITYLGTGLVAIGYTAYILTQDERLRSPQGLVAALAYALLAALWVWCWLSALRRYRRHSRSAARP
jgi:hypothetical protein